MHSIWCWTFLASPPAANPWIPYSRTLFVIGGKHILAGDTSCSRAPNAPAQRAFCMLGTHPIAFSFSVAASALASPISRQWATGGTARRAVSRSCALGLNGQRAALCRSSLEACRRERTNIFWGCWRTTRQCESRGRVTLETIDQISIVPICGGNAEIDLLTLVVGQFVDNARASGRRGS